MNINKYSLEILVLFTAITFLLRLPWLTPEKKIFYFDVSEALQKYISSSKYCSLKL